MSFVHACRNLLFVPVPTRSVPTSVGQTIGLVLLVDPAGIVIMRVLVADAMTQSGGTLIMTVTQVCRHFTDHTVSYRRT